MQRKLAASGTGWELYMPKDILKLLGFNPLETQVLFTVSKNILKIREINPEKINPNLMIKKFNKSGNGYGLYLSASILQLLEINPEIDEVKYLIEDNILKIKKA